MFRISLKNLFKHTSAYPHIRTKIIKLSNEHVSQCRTQKKRKNELRLLACSLRRSLLRSPGSCSPVLYTR